MGLVPVRDKVGVCVCAHVWHSNIFAWLRGIAWDGWVVDRWMGV